MNELSVFDELYQRLAGMEPKALADVLRAILPPQEIYARMEGTLFALHFQGLRMFDISARLQEVGIEAGDPRAAVFRQLQGNLIDQDIIAGARRISQREETVCRHEGGVAVFEGGKRCWWVPLKATSQFVQKTDALVKSYQDYRDREILGRYDELKDNARRLVHQAAKKAYQTLQAASQQMTPADFEAQAETLFAERFPSREEVENQFCAQRETRQTSIPKPVMLLMEELRAAETRRLEVETERLQAERDLATQQARLSEIEIAMRADERRRLRQESELREDMLRQALSPEIERARAIVGQFSGGLIKIGSEIIAAGREGKPIHPATRKRWKMMLQNLSLVDGNQPVQQAVEALLARTQADQPALAPQEIKKLENQVEKALAEMARRVEIESNAESIWRMINARKGEQALGEVYKLRANLKTRDEELEAILDVLTEREAA